MAFPKTAPHPAPTPSGARALPRRKISPGRSERSTTERQVPAQRWAGALIGWFITHARDLPWRRTLEPYAIWISEIMLQQTQVKTVIPYWERWMRELPNAHAL